MICISTSYQCKYKKTIILSLANDEMSCAHCATLTFESKTIIVLLKTVVGVYIGK